MGEGPAKVRRIILCTVIPSPAMPLMPGSSTQSDIAMSAPKRSSNKCFILNYLEVSEGLRCERIQHTLGCVQLVSRSGIPSRMCNRALKCDAGSNGEVGFAWWSGDLAAKQRQSNQQNLLRFRTWLGLGLSCCRGRLRDLLRLSHFRFLCRLSYLAFSIYFSPFEFTL